MKKIRKILPVFIFVAIMGITTTVFANTHTTTISVPKGSVRFTNSYKMTKGKPRLYFRISAIDGSRSTTAKKSTTMDIEILTSSDKKLVSARRTYDSSWIGGETKLDGSVRETEELMWRAKFDTSCAGTKENPSFESDYVVIASN